MWSMIASFALQFMQYNIWLIFTLGVPGQIIILLIFQLGRIKTNTHKKIDNEENEKDSE